jgi:predicted DNA-binding transcriptional regulator YafY
VTHRGFGKSEPTTFNIKPYGLKIFKQRWDVLAESEYPDHRLLVYALDRFEAMERTDESYEIPEDFDVARHFQLSYGVTGLNGTPELIQLKVDASQVPYFRSLPLHRSQKEEETTEDYSVFSYFVVPTYELRQEILSHGANVEVVYPKTLRAQIKEEIAAMHKLYK